MATLEDLDDAQMREALSTAAQRRTPAQVTVRAGNRWTTLHSRLLHLHHGDLWLEYPHDGAGGHPHEFQNAERVGLSFKLKHHKYLCAPPAKRDATVDLSDGQSERVLCVGGPAAMQRLQRRAYQRVPVPPGRIVRAAFWPGGREAEPAGPCPERPVWSGQVSDLSAGGFQVRAAAEAVAFLEAGFTMGVRLSFGATGEDIVYADAQFRHAQDDGDMSLIGFQFLALSQSDEGQEALRTVARHAAEFRRANEHAGTAK